jgi:hypothetical protein
MKEPTVRITLSLPDETVARVRIEAAKAGQSMSRWIGGQVHAWWEREQKQSPAIENEVSGSREPRATSVRKATRRVARKP